MKSLASMQRKQLERAVIEARGVAEAGAKAALEALATQNHKPYAHMNSEERALRRRLRAHGRQLGDRRDPRSGSQAMDRLAHECAYEHWHGMLFARFLAENELLIEPETGVPVTLQECEELARDQGIDKWMLAATFAQGMLPQVFRADHPAFQVRLAQEHRLKLEQLIGGLPTAVFTATDSLGWVYQFWQSQKKNQVNRSEVKIGADELPAVTQLFTEPYMVNFLLDNSLGAWWAARRLSDDDLSTANSEVELRRKAALPAVPLDYLRFAQADDPANGGKWRLAAGAFESWPNHLSELKVLDPCCGSGHFLIAAFAMLVPMRMEVEGLGARQTIESVLRGNLHGLELDPRCVELAAFALALAAWTYPEAGGYRPLPELNVACSGLAPNATKEQWMALAEQAAAAGGLPAERDLLGVEDSLLSGPLRTSLEGLYDLFRHAPERGSLINPRTVKADLVQIDYESARTLLTSILEHEHTTDEQTEQTVAAQGMAHAAELLAGRYHLVITNVPYLTRSKQAEGLRNFCEQHYFNAKRDLATVFLQRCLELSKEGGAISLVLPENWLFQISYRKLRERLLGTETWRLVTRLGSGAFETIGGEVVKAILLTLSHDHPVSDPVAPFGRTIETRTMYGLDISESQPTSEKAAQLTGAAIHGVKQARQLRNPDAAILLNDNHESSQLALVASAYQGIATADNQSFTLNFWELKSIAQHWDYLQSAPKTRCHFGGRTKLLRTSFLTHRNHSGNISGRQAWRQSGVAVSETGRLLPTIYSGEYFICNCHVLVPGSSGNLLAIWQFAESGELEVEVRKRHPKLAVKNGYFGKIPFDLDRWKRIAEEQYPYGLPQPYSDDPTQWIFHGHPCRSVVWDETEKRTARGPLRADATVLQIATARLLGYRWPAEQDAGMKLAEGQREWVSRCDALLDHADTDGIVCIPSARGEDRAADRLSRLLAASYGDAWNAERLSRLLAGTGAADLDGWLRNRFFEQHCKLFHHRPFVWHVWDGRATDGFHALVNYHKLAAGGGKSRQCLESLAYSYLGDWITRQQDGVAGGTEGAEGRLSAALELQKRLKLILEGEPPFDIFVRWKSLDEQPIGWNPDINDGVRLNIRPFMADDLPGGRKGAGILRIKPNIKWTKDRGKEPFRDQQSFPWFWRNGQFTGERINDVHLTTSEESHQPSSADKTLQ